MLISSIQADSGESIRPPARETAGRERGVVMRTLQLTKLLLIALIMFGCALGCGGDSTAPGTTPDGGDDNLPAVTGYPVVDTNQSNFYGVDSEIAEPAAGDVFYGQDAHYVGNQPRYQDNEDGTVTDLVTGLMWQQAMGQIEWADAEAAAAADTTGGYDDWR
jgi:hypothetical protein